MNPEIVKWYRALRRWAGIVDTVATTCGLRLYPIAVQS